jgi:uncharacterized protein YaaN involved in tellurite resistance
MSTQTTETEIEKVESILPTAVKEKVEEAIMNQDDNLPEILPEDEDVLQKAVAEIDINDRNSVISFGSSAQAKLDEISNRMLDGVKSQETGAAGNALNNMVAKIRGFDMDKLNPNRKLNWWDKLLGRAKPLAVFLQQYEEVRDHIDVISNDLEKHKSTLIRDVVSLEKLYEANLDYFHNLELYIKAGDIKLQEFNRKILPEYEKSAEDEEMLAVQNLKDMRAFRDDLERRVHDLRLSRQVAMQALPSIRLIQENDKSLINKIGSTLVNTVPLWRNQLAQTVTIFRSHDAATAIKEATDLTNDLLEKNAEGLREANAEVRRQMERGVFDIESIKKANQTLIETLNDSLRISEEGKAARKKAVIELEETEAKLKEALLAVKAKKEASEHEQLEEVAQNAVQNTTEEG